MFPLLQTGIQYRNIGSNFNKALLKSNQKRINYDYCAGQKILKYDNSIVGKLESKTTGPFDISHVHTNGTVTILLHPGIS